MVIKQELELRNIDNFKMKDISVGDTVLYTNSYESIDSGYNYKKGTVKKIEKCYFNGPCEERKNCDVYIYIDTCKGHRCHYNALGTCRIKKLYKLNFFTEGDFEI